MSRRPAPRLSWHLSAPPLVAVAVALAVLAAALGASARMDAWAGHAPAYPETRAARRAALVRARTFAVHLTDALDVDAARRLDLLITDPDAHAAELDALAGGPLVLAYLNVGEVESYRWFAGRVDPAWTLGDNPHWPGHRFVDARHEGWQRLVVDEIAARILARPVDGLFLDMLDVGVVFPETRDGVRALVHALRAAYPEALLVLNRGQPFWDALGPDVDGVLAEGVFAGYDPATGAHRATPSAESAALVAAMRALRARTGGAALVLDYPGSDPALHDHARRMAARYSFPLFLGAPALDGSAPHGVR